MALEPMVSVGVAGGERSDVVCGEQSVESLFHQDQSVIGECGKGGEAAAQSGGQQHAYFRR